MAAHILCAPLYMYVTPDRSRYYDAPVSFFYTAFFLFLPDMAVFRLPADIRSFKYESLNKRCGGENVFFI